MPERIKDFFVSYTQSDLPWAEWIAWQLEAAGYLTVIQAWDFTAGSNFPLEMHHGKLGSNRLVAVLSPEYLESKFCAAEWASAFTQDPDSKSRTLVPIRVKECQPNGLLEAIVYIDLVNKTEHEAKFDLLSQITTQRRKPIKPPPFPFKTHPPFPGPKSPQSDQVQFKVVITGTVNKDQTEMIEAMVAHLRSLSGDASLTLLEIRKGSIILHLRGLRSTFDLITSLHQADYWAESPDFDIVSVELEPQTAALPRLASLETISKTISLMRREAQRYIDHYAATTASIMSGPIPGSNSPLVGAGPLMITKIASIYGFVIDLNEAATLTATFTSQGAVTAHLGFEALKFIPAVGWLMQPALSVAITKTIGKLAIEYFEAKVADIQNEHSGSSAPPESE